MWSSLFARTPWRLVVVCILCVNQVFCREAPCNQELMNDITALLEEKFLNMNSIIIEKFQYLEDKTDNTDNKLLDISQRLSQIERSLGNVNTTVESIKLLSENIELEASSIGESSLQSQRLQKNTFRKIEDTRDVILQESQEMKKGVSSAISYVTEMLQKEFRETTNTSFVGMRVAIEELKLTNKDSMDEINENIGEFTMNTHTSFVDMREAIEDINECIIKRSECEHVRTNTEGSCVWFCMEGYQLKSDNKTCEDIDECTSNSNDCDHVCTNTEGSFDCSCRKGYELRSDNKTCEEELKCSTSEGYFTSPGGQCFKVYQEKRYTWQQGAAKCQAEDLQLARLRDDEAVWIRKYVYDNYGSADTHIGGRADGTYMRWTRDQEKLLRSNSLWYPSEPSSLSTDHCLGLLISRSIGLYPNASYASWPCFSYKSPRILCEWVNSTTAGR